MRTAKILCALTLSACMANMAFFLCAGCSSDSSQPQDAGPDRRRPIPREDAGLSCDPSEPFGPTVLVPGLPEWSSAGRLTSDELTIYFEHAASPDAAVGQRHLSVATRTSRERPFEKIRPLSDINSAGEDANPWVSPNGWMFFYASNRSGAWRIYASEKERADADFGRGQPVEGLATSGELVDPFVYEGTELWFKAHVGADGNIYRSAWKNGGYGPAVAATELNSTYGETLPTLSADGLTIFFGSSRTNGSTYDIWTATRPAATETFSSIAPLAEITAAGVNTPSDDAPSWISPDQCRLYMHSNRDGSYRIYVAWRPEVQ